MPAAAGSLQGHLVRSHPPTRPPHAPRRATGNRPSTSLLLPSLTPFRVGQLLALYENRVATQVMVVWVGRWLGGAGRFEGGWAATRRVARQV